MKDFIFEHNLENKLMEEYGLIKGVKSLQDIMIKASEDTCNEELNQFIDALIMINNDVDTILFKHDQIIKEFQENYCN